MVTISVVTVCLNAFDGMRATAHSLMDQSFKSFEWVVVDGGSTDGTVSFLTRFHDKRLRFISEPDEGIYDAMNKGLSMVAGKWIIFLGAGDTLHSNDTLSNFFSYLPNIPIGYSFAYGGVSYRETREDVVYWTPGEVRNFQDLSFSVPPHSSTFFRVTSLQSRFDPSFRILGDRLFMIENSEGRFFFLPFPITVMLEGGVSYYSKNRWRKRRELLRISRMCEPRPGFIHHLIVLLAWLRDDLTFFIPTSLRKRSRLSGPSQ